MLLDVGEDHLHGCHTELIRAKKHDRQTEGVVLVDDPPTPMVGCIVHGDDCLQAPIPILPVEMGTELEQEIPEALLIVIAQVD